MTATPDLLAAARAVAPLVAARSDDIERNRGLPPDIVSAMTDAGLFDMLVRPSLGGPGADPVAICRAVEVVARADASAGWCSMVSSTSGYLTGWLSADAAAELFGVPARLRLSGSSRPLGHAVPVDGGYRVSGRWDFASGIGHATALIASCIVEGAGPRVAFVSADRAVVDDTWTTMGMSGTGSHDMVIDDVFVPEAHTAWFEDEPAEDLPLYDQRLLRIATHSPAVAVALGAGRAALDDFIELASVATTSSAIPLRERPDVQIAMARAEAGLDGARRRFYETLDEAWSLVVAGRADTRDAIAGARLAMAVAADAALTAADGVLAAAGTSGVFSRHRLERRVRDLHVIRQFSAFKSDNLIGAGRVLLGLEPEGLGW